MILLILFLIGAALIAGSMFAPASALAQGIMLIVGLALVILTPILAMFTRLYRKTSANMAFVKTGMGGAEPILDGGKIIFPILHQVILVSLETMRLNVERRGTHALITKDNLRVDLSAEFYIKVQANKEDILQAARSLGNRSVEANAVSELVEEKLVSALRTVAATKDLVELHSKRDEFATAVQQIVIHDLAHNGLTLESVTISSLDQTDPSQLQERNVFDAQGLRKIAEITQKARVERNIIEQESQRQVVQQNVGTKKKVLDMERDQAEFEAEQRMKVANVRAAREREVAEFRLAQEEAVARREIEKQKMIETSGVEKLLAIEQAEVAKKIAMIEKNREQETSEIAKTTAVDVAARSKEVAVAQKERERAIAQAAMFAAEADREGARQKIAMVQLTAEADREAQKKLISAQQQVAEKKLRDQTQADVLAYTRVKEAEGEKLAAEMQYEAKLRLAEGDSAAMTKKSEGDRAIKMVDVTVERERVGVEQVRVEVERQSLANREQYNEAALQFELDKLRIQADKEVRIAAAQALGNMLSKANMQIFGDPETMSKMSAQFMRATSMGVAVDGFLKSIPTEGRDLIERLGSAVMSQVKPTPAAEAKPAPPQPEVANR